MLFRTGTQYLIVLKIYNILRGVNTFSLATPHHHLNSFDVADDGVCEMRIFENWFCGYSK